MTLSKRRLSHAFRTDGYLFTFLLGLLLSFLIFLPFLILDHGIFLYYGDYNVQQIPFYSLAHDAVQSGQTGWNWLTDLGTNFVGSYSFYLLGSPFFWITLLFPSGAVPYLMAPLLMLKFALTGVTGCAFLRRFVKNGHTAVFGGLLYAFSGFNLYNIFFNHFNEVVMLFPLLLIGMEELVVNRRRGLFALTVALCAIVNYYFFFGEVLFCVLYYIVRGLFSQEFRLNLRTFASVALESVIGLLLSAVLLLPSMLVVLSNPRTSEYLSGFNLLFYGNSQRYGLILSSFFFPPDVPARPNFFPDSNAKWSSVSMYLPLVSMTGVIAYLKGAKKTWLKRMLCICFVVCFIPVLNAAFSLFNYSYYARWFFMPLLLMALATCIAFENMPEHFPSAFRWTALFTGTFALIGILPKKVNDEYVFFSLPSDPGRFWVYVLIAAISLICCTLLYSLRSRPKLLFRCGTTSLAAITLLTGIFMLSSGRGSGSRYDEVVTKGLNGSQNLSLDSMEGFYRIDTFDELDNLGMFWRTPTINAFHSVVPSSIMDYYEWIGGERGVASRPEPSLLGVRGLLSVKYAFSDSLDYTPMPGFTKIGVQNGYSVYENEYYVPMGFSYDYAITMEQIEANPAANKDRLLLRALLLSDEDYETVSDILPQLSDEEAANGNYSDEMYFDDCLQRKAEAVDSFTYDSYSFTAETSYAEERVVFFSVPYESGWSAEVNGEPADILKANAGFMAVRVPSGESTIRFTYHTPGLTAGLLISLMALLLLLCYLLLFRFLRKRNKCAVPLRYAHRYTTENMPKATAHEAYLAYLSQKSQKNQSDPQD